MWTDASSLCCPASHRRQQVKEQCAWCAPQEEDGSRNKWHAEDKEGDVSLFLASAASEPSDLLSDTLAMCASARSAGGRAHLQQELQSLQCCAGCMFDVIHSLKFEFKCRAWDTYMFTHPLMDVEIYISNRIILVVSAAVAVMVACSRCRRMQRRCSVLSVRSAMRVVALKAGIARWRTRDTGPFSKSVRRPRMHRHARL